MTKTGGWRWVGAAAALLAGCGGGGGLASVGGSVSGLAPGTAVTLQINGGETLVVGANGGFAFREELLAGRRYDIEIVAQPARATCTIANASGRVNDNASRVDNVTVVCTQLHSVRGTVSGLVDGTSVTLQNNGGDSLALSADGAFVFATLLAEGATYAVTVSQQPNGRTCTVQTDTGTGTVATADVTNVVVRCVP